jgi:hypothetical protein
MGRGQDRKPRMVTPEEERARRSRQFVEYAKRRGHRGAEQMASVKRFADWSAQRRAEWVKPRVVVP